MYFFTSSDMTIRAGVGTTQEYVSVLTIIFVECHPVTLVDLSVEEFTGTGGAVAVPTRKREVETSVQTGVEDILVFGDCEIVVLAFKVEGNVVGCHSF